MSDATTNPLFHRYIPPATVTSHQCRRLYIPNHEQYRAAINELLSRLMIREVWDASPFTMSADDAATLAGEMLIKFWSEDCMLGVIMASARSTVPEWALPCDGSTYDAADYPDLFAILAADLILDATHFKTPDLRGRTILAAGNPDYPPFSTGGEYEHALTTSEMPSHSHLIDPHAHGITEYVNVPVPAGVDPVFASSMTGFPGSTAPTGYLTANATGGDEHHNNLPPYAVVEYIIVAK